MKILVLSLSIAAAVSGLIAAWYWNKAANFFAVPGWVQHHFETTGMDWEAKSKDWINHLQMTLLQGGRLNSIAARWTAIAAALGGAAAIAGLY
jgi:hypothetical protein